MMTDRYVELNIARWVLPLDTNAVAVDIGKQHECTMCPRLGHAGWVMQAGHMCTMHQMHATLHYGRLPAVELSKPQVLASLLWP